MSLEILADQVEQDPVSAQAAFIRLDQALDLVLPGGDTHKRYQDIEAVGLAAVIAGDSTTPDSYNPLDPSTLGRVSFMTDNMSEHPEAWAPLGVDPSILGGAIPEGMGRFTAFALAKINNLTMNRALLSSVAGELSLAPGSVGFAGGQRLYGTLLAMSGLWEVHDHVVGGIYKNEIGIETTTDTSRRTADDLAEEIEPVFAGVKSLHDGVEAADIPRGSLPKLLLEANGLLLELSLRQMQKGII